MSAGPRYTVRRLGWIQAPHGDPYTRRVPAAEVVAHFGTFDEAEYHRRVLELDARTGENPFRFGGAALFFQTSLDAPRLHDWLLDGGVDPPAEQLRHADWKAWWAAFAHTWAEDRLAHAWHGLDKVRFFDVAADDPGDPVWAVVENGYVRYGGVPAADRVSGTVAGVYRTRRAAAAAARRPAAALLEVPADGPPAAAGFLVQRRAFDRDGRVCHGPQGQDTGARVPVRVFTARESAVAFRDAMAAAAREVVNPFRVFPVPMSGMPADEFAAAVAALRPPLPWPPRADSAGWAEWWDLCQDELTADQRAGAWELFAGHPLFEVLGVEVRDG